MLLKGEGAEQTPDCGKSPDLSPGAGTGSRAAGRRCAQAEDLVVCLTSGRLRRSWIAGSEPSLQQTHSRTAKNSPTGTHGREGSQ